MVHMKRYDEHQSESQKRAASYDDKVMHLEKVCMFVSFLMNGWNRKMCSEAFNKSYKNSEAVLLVVPSKLQSCWSAHATLY